MDNTTDNAQTINTSFKTDDEIKNGYKKNSLNKAKKGKKQGASFKGKDEKEKVDNEFITRNTTTKHLNKNRRKSSSIEIISATNVPSSNEHQTLQSDAQTQTKPLLFSDYKNKNRKNSIPNRKKHEDVADKELSTSEIGSTVLDVPFEHKTLSFDQLKTKKKVFEKKKPTQGKSNNKKHHANSHENLNEEYKHQSKAAAPKKNEETEKEACNIKRKVFEKKRIPKELLSVMTVGSPKKPQSQNESSIASTNSSTGVSLHDTPVKEIQVSVTSSPSAKNMNDETHIPLKYRSSTPTSSSGISVSDSINKNGNLIPDSTGNPKNCPYLNRMKNNTSKAVKDEPVNKNELHEEKVDFETVAPEPEKPSLFKSLLGNSEPSDFFNSLLNEKLMSEDRAWEPASLIDISQINSKFEAPKFTENTSTIVMTNAEKEILNHMQKEKHPDDNGGPYVLKLSNMQKGFNSEVLIDTILKPKKILFLRAKFFWEPNFKVSLDELKKICFLEVKYFEEMERCIELLKNNSYLIKATKCTHEDFSKVANLQNMKWGDPEFIDLNNPSIYKLAKYKVNLSGDPIGILKDGEKSSDSDHKLPSLPTLGNSAATKKRVDASESIYSKLSSQIMTNKEKSRRNSTSASNSPLIANSPLAPATLGDHIIDKNVSLSPSTNSSPLLNSSTPVMGNPYKNNYGAGSKFGGNKPYNKNKHNTYNKGSPSFNNGRYKGTTGGSSGSKPSANPPRFFDFQDSKSFGFASGFVKNTSSRH
ncbi:hypothetical protein QEN19_001091 [Hanseniaspora menglaensis]